MKNLLFISLIHLIQNPEIYHQKQVRVVAFASMAFESKAIYVSKEDLDNAVTKNAIWLEASITEETRRMHRKYVIVEGSFSKDNLGHLQMYSGAIENITRIDLWKGDRQSD
jgi:hypothetical protein